MDNTVTQIAGPQAGQLVASRYRLASFHRGDGNTEVWRALDESTNQMVSLEFLRDVNPVSRERFLAGARRLASVAEPSVMRVAGIHDDADGTFIVFEHLVHIPAPVEWAKPAAIAAAPVPQVAAPPAVQTAGVAPDATAPTVETPMAPEAATGDHGLSLLLYALRSRELSLIDQPLLEESMIEFLDLTVAELKAVRLDPDLLPDARSFVVSLLTAGPRGLASAVGRIATFRPHLPVRAPRMSQPKQPKPPKQPKQPKVSTPRMKETPVAAAKPMKMPKIKPPRAPRAASGPGLRIRWGRVLTRGLTLGVLAAVLVSLPPGILGNLDGVASNVANVAGNVASQVSTTIGEKIASVQTTPGLQRATFELPPLSSYAAAFESQGPYPTARPNGTVEWVVALRNTGSVGWYRGIDGAQASLALPDGTAAAVQNTAYVGPGQVGWFVVHFPAPSQPGVTRVPLRPRIDGRGALPDLGIYVTVTVSPNP
ncbi:MAG TPA: hypothetical protein VK732_00305 [Verrucomicrobiae bacterium]|nr:hypothetical protein [Verrucomicrobiae bacterium]